MQATPRTLIRQVQKDLSPTGPPVGGPAGRAEARNLMKAFIGAEKVPSKDYTKILENPVFAGCYPRIVDKVFYLERFVSELPRSHQQPQPATNKKQKAMSRGVQNSQNDPYEAFTPNGFTPFEHSLICINITLAIGIVLTLLLLSLFFCFLNSALYLKEEIS